ncbi:MAG: hypothetical protein ACI855_001452 [Myxococcota bacterium]
MHLGPAMGSADAALRLLTDLHGEFNDWGLALAAYNMGSRAFRGAIAEQGTSHVIARVQAEALPSYAVDVMAAAGILRAEGLID